MFNMKRSTILLLIIALAFAIVGCQDQTNDSSNNPVEEVTEPVSEVIESEEDATDIEETTTIVENDPLSPITINDGETISMHEPPEGYKYIVTSFLDGEKNERIAVPVPRNLFKDNECLTIAFEDVRPYLDENYPSLKDHNLSEEDNPELEILDETSLAIDDTDVSEEYVNNTIIINDIVSTGVELPSEAVRASIESFAQSFGPMTPDNLVLTSLTTVIGDFDVYIYEYEHNSEANMSRIGVFFPLGTNMHLIQVIQEGDINAPSPFLDEINKLLSSEG